MPVKDEQGSRGCTSRVAQADSWKETTHRVATQWEWPSIYATSSRENSRRQKQRSNELHVDVSVCILSRGGVATLGISTDAVFGFSRRNRRKRRRLLFSGSPAPGE